MPLHFPILLGTARLGRESEQVAHWVLAELNKRTEFVTSLIDVKDYLTPFTLPPWQQKSEHVKSADLRAKVGAADGLILVLPEYNHGYPGEFKLVFDQLKTEPARKPVGIVSVSSGAIGGARGAEQVLPYLVNMGMVPMPNAVHIMNVEELFDNKGMKSEFAERNNKNLTKLLDNLVWFGEALKRARG